MLRKIIHNHVKLILSQIKDQLQHTGRSVFAVPGAVTLTEDGECTHLMISSFNYLVNYTGEFQALKVLLCADKYILVSLDPRTGRFTLRDVGDLAASTHGVRLLRFADRINDHPSIIFNVLVSIRLQVGAITSTIATGY